LPVTHKISNGLHQAAVNPAYHSANPGKVLFLNPNYIVVYRLPCVNDLLYLSLMNKKTIMKRTLYLHMAAIAILFLATINGAKAQHCPDGCTVNINGPSFVKVGDVVTYTVTPSAPEIPHGATWDELHFLDGYADIVDQGVDANGDEFITLHFISAGYPWFTYTGSYSCCHAQDFDEMALTITP
jgi:hypothetical protein